jgi:hypothetical protein
MGHIMRRATTGLISSMLTGLFIAAMGGVFALVGLSVMADAEPPEGGVATTAEVIGSVEGYALIDGIARPRFSPVYEYEDVDGQLHRVTDHISAGARPPAVGSTVEVSYLPGEPDSVRRTDVDKDWLWWFVIGGGITFAVGTTAALLSLAFSVPTIVRSRALRRSTTELLVGRDDATTADHHTDSERHPRVAIGRARRR